MELSTQAALVVNDNKLMSFVYSWTKNRADAFDIIQEAYLKVHERIQDSDRPISHLRGLMFTTARNLLTDRHRKDKIRRNFELEQVLRDPEGYLSPEQICIGREEWGELQKAVAQLPPKAQRALRYIREDGLSYETVGKIMKIKTHSVRRLVERAVDILKENR